jgi:RNA polymerase-binding transcription factor DksA
MEYSKEELIQIKNNLLSIKVKLEEELIKIKSQDPFNDSSRLLDNAASDTDANEESSHDQIVSIVNQIETELETVLQALKRLENNQYGICINCGNQIEIDRLKVLNTAETCIQCEKTRTTSKKFQ